MAYPIDHVMLGVSDLERSVEWYQSLLDYELDEERTIDGRRSVFVTPTGGSPDCARLELREVGDEPTVGDAWGHIAVRVNDLDGSYQELMDGGVPDYRDPESCGGRYAFVKDPDGHEVELVKRDQGPRWSLDHIMMRVEDADAALGFWTRKFEYDHVGRWEADSFANFFMRSPSAEEDALAVELTYNYDGRTYEFGDAWDHVGIRVDDLDDTWERLQTREAITVADPSDTGIYEATISDPDGHGVQLFE